MKTNILVQAGSNELIAAEIEKAVKESLKAEGVKVNTVETLDLDIKPVENEVYYVANLKSGKKISSKLENC